MAATALCEVAPQPLCPSASAEWLAFSPCAIESAELMVYERVCADVASDRTADHVRQHAAQELFAAVTAAQDDERAEVSRRLCDEVGHALDSVLVGLRRLGTPRKSSIEIPVMQDPTDELRALIDDALSRTRRMAHELRTRVSHAVA